MVVAVSTVELKAETSIEGVAAVVMTFTLGLRNPKVYKVKNLSRFVNWRRRSHRVGSIIYHIVTLFNFIVSIMSIWQ